MRDLILKCDLPLGDIVLLTAAVRDLHICYPGEFRTAIATNFPELWENSPYVTPQLDISSYAEVINCEYPLIDYSNVLPYHVIHGFPHFLNEKLRRKIIPTVCKGDIYLSGEEREWNSQVAEWVGEEIPFWIVVTGGKSDVTVKWWPTHQYQEVIDHFAGKIQFVQVGASDDHHPALNGVIDLRGKTNIRQLIRLIYHSQGVLCPVTSLMHLAAAVESRPGRPRHRACIVVAGGREPSQWEAYPHHQFLHTNGGLLCCDQGGCWKSRTRPLGDGAEFDRPENLCLNPGLESPRCMELIKSAHVISRAEAYFKGGMLEYLTSEQSVRSKEAIKEGATLAWDELALERRVYRTRAEEQVAAMPSYPERFRGRGIVICGGGVGYFVNAWVCIRMLRKLGCKLPIQLWHIGEDELDDRMSQLVTPWNVRCIDAVKVAGYSHAHRLNGWSLKPFALLNSPFKEALLLDADNVPIVDPEYLFETQNYLQTGAVFWPDLRRFSSDDPAWEVFGVAYQNDIQFESGQILINKEKVWQPMFLANWYNENSDYYYSYVYGDKNTYYMAFRRMGMSYAMPDVPVQSIEWTMCQHDFDGRRIFQHRYLDKWNLKIPPQKIDDFHFEKDCRRYLRELSKEWNGKIRKAENGCLTSEEQVVITQLTKDRYTLAVEGAIRERVTFFEDGRINSSHPEQKWSWTVRSDNGKIHLEISSRGKTICNFLNSGNGCWQSMEGEAARLTRIARKASKARIHFRGPLNVHTGYGLHSIQIISDFLNWGYDVKVSPLGLSEKFSPIPGIIKDCLYYEDEGGDWELVLNGPGFRPSPKRKTVLFTMWESTRLPEKAVDNFNEAECLIVPCQWNKRCFLEQGIRVPIYQVPLGINTDTFRYASLPANDICVFGTAGRTAAGGMRKGFDRVMKAFSEAFPKENDVRLTVKIFPDCEVPIAADSRISIIQRYMTEGEVAEWFKKITCFVSGARGEGWGLMQHQALATGRPVISIDYGGVAEFFNKDRGYSVEYRLLPAEGHYSNCGLWAEPSHRSLVQRMREVYHDREKATDLGKRGAKEVKKRSWQASNRELLRVLKKVGMLSK